MRDPDDLDPAIQEPAGLQTAGIANQSMDQGDSGGHILGWDASRGLGTFFSAFTPLTWDFRSESEASRLEVSAEIQRLLFQLLDELFLTTGGFSFFYISGALSKDHFPPQSFQIFLSSLKCHLSTAAEED